MPTNQTAEPVTPAAHLPYIAPDTYVGRWSIPAGRCRGENWTAEELHASLPAGEVAVRWESFGVVAGVEMFARERVIADERGISVYNSDGGLTLVHPLGTGRIVRLLVK